MIVQHGMGAIQRFGEDDPHHGVGKGETGQRPAQVGLLEDLGPEAIRAADRETKVAAVLLALGQPPGQLEGG